MQDGYQFIGEDGTFILKNADNYSYLYFPIAGEHGIKSAVTPNLGGDCKLDQNTFVLEPVSAENLHNNRGTRNFWCYVEGKGAWSATGNSAEEIAKKFTKDADTSEVTGGFMWHTTSRTSKKYGLSARITSFVPMDENMELMCVEIKNKGKDPVCITPTAAVPIYGRSADNIWDHRHVTSLLHRIKTVKNGVLVRPTLSFDERGHQKNEVTYFVCGTDGEGNLPECFYPTVADYIGEGGNFEQPEAVMKNRSGVGAGAQFAGEEAIGGIRFQKRTLAPAEAASYIIMIGAKKDAEEIGAEQTILDWTGKYQSKEQVKIELLRVKEEWNRRVNVRYHTGDDTFDPYMRWVSFQPMLRRIYGCSFLPHHDYGKGGRGWRDLWQDCLALLIMNPDGVRQMLLDNFAGVRMDGTNATIIGEHQGEFVADRNNITRVWMDHGVWPYLTTQLYIDETGDIEILDELVPYFKDKQTNRGTGKDMRWDDAYGTWQKTDTGMVYEGSVLEHLLIQNLTAFYEVGEHGYIRLRGADWNDAIDMAPERGESVAFTNAYAGNLKNLAELLAIYREKTENQTVELAREFIWLFLDEEEVYVSVEKRQELLQTYGNSCIHFISGEKEHISIDAMIQSLTHKAEWLMHEIREKEWVTDSKGNGWFNGYYDNHGRRVEGEMEQGVRMMLTSQVFAIMAGTAEEEQIKQIVKSADRYLYRKEAGGYRLNTDFGEVKMDMGRMFGFAYGEKENGAVFSHMAVMYANALYQRGYAREGYRVLQALYEQSVHFETSRIYPGIPEYFNSRGRGMYHYLTGAASWYMLTVITEVFGVKGKTGDLVLEPKLMSEQFDRDGNAELTLPFAGKNWKVIYENRNKKPYGAYELTQCYLDEAVQTEAIAENRKSVVISKEKLEQLDREKVHTLHVILS